MYVGRNVLLATSTVAAILSLMILSSCREIDPRLDPCSSGIEKARALDYEGALQEWRAHKFDDTPKEWYRIARGCILEINPNAQDQDIADWLRQAADTGSPGAMILLSVVRVNGIGRDRDMEKAKEHLLEAEKRGSPAAKSMITVLKMKGDPLDDLTFRRHYIINDSIDGQLCADLIYDHESAIEHCNIAIRSENISDRGLASTFHNRGYHYRRLGLNDRAMEDFSRAIEINPNSVTSYISRGMIYEEMGDRERAKSDFGEAYRISPYSTDAIEKAKEYGLVP